MNSQGILVKYKGNECATLYSYDDNKEIKSIEKLLRCYEQINYIFLQKQNILINFSNVDYIKFIYSEGE